MATTKIWPIKTGRLSSVIGYIANLEKTDESRLNPEERASLYAVANYVTDELKTEEKKFVTCVNLTEGRELEQMTMTKKRFNKTGGILAHHAYQSFKPGEVTPDVAHEISVKLAKEMWGGDFEIIVATHINSDCIHSHILINSVAFTDGHKYNGCRENYERFKKISDRLCREYGFSVIENPQYGRTKNYKYYNDEKLGKMTKDQFIKRDIDECIAVSLNGKQFEYLMRQRGYTFNAWCKYPTISHPAFQRPRRLNTLGDRYTLQGIQNRLHDRWTPRVFVYPEQKDPAGYFFFNPDDPFHYIFEFDRIDRLYVHFVRGLTIIKSEPDTNREVARYLHDELVKFDMLVENQNLLLDNGLRTDDDVTRFKQECEKDVNDLTEARNVFRNALKRAVRAEDKEKQIELNAEIRRCSEALEVLRRNVKICDRILMKKPDIEQRMREIREISEQKRYIPEVAARLNTKTKTRGVAR